MHNKKKKDPWKTYFDHLSSGKPLNNSQIQRSVYDYEFPNGYEACIILSGFALIFAYKYQSYWALLVGICGLIGTVTYMFLKDKKKK